MSEAKKVGRKPKPKNDRIFNCLRPHTDMSAIVQYGEAVDRGENPDPNVGIMSKEEFLALAVAQIESVKANEAVSSMPAAYQPVIVGAGVSSGARFLTAGQKARNKVEPENWPSDLEPWQEGYRMSDSHRRCHKTDARDLVIDREQNVLTVGQNDFVVGTDKVPAILLINASKTGSYGENIRCGKSVSFGDNEDIINLVGRFNNSYYVDYFDDGTVPGCPVVWAPNMCVDQWGYFELDGRRLSNTEIRSILAFDSSNTELTFIPLDAPIVGKSLSQFNLWQDVCQSMSDVKTKDSSGLTALDRFKSRSARGEEKGDLSDNAWRNLKVQCRTNPKELFPFGFFSAQTGVIPCLHFQDSTDKEYIRFVIGCRVGSAYSETLWEAKSRLKSKVESKSVETTESAPVAEETAVEAIMEVTA